MRLTVAVGVVVGLAGCSVQVPVTDGRMRPFACPAAGTRTMVERASGPPYTTVWLGADPKDPELCLSENASGKNKRQRVFGRWNFDDDSGGSVEERIAARQAVANLLAGRSGSAGFVLRGKTGEQISQQWRVEGPDDQSIQGRTVKAVRIRINYTYSGNASNNYSDVWYAPDYNLFIRSEGTSDLESIYIWRIVRINDRHSLQPKR
ncbi:MAG: hypothetical protein EOO77_37655 [Oxalobacteraceae bacterium]|nr:MAG: hypothetical protein EOO77_37655 [Oxalobacteraceae bacterium]